MVCFVHHEKILQHMWYWLSEKQIPNQCHTGAFIFLLKTTNPPSLPPEMIYSPSREYTYVYYIYSTPRVPFFIKGNDSQKCAAHTGLLDLTDTHVGLSPTRSHVTVSL
jgi:hypothetical protein